MTPSTFKPFKPSKSSNSPKSAIPEPDKIRLDRLLSKAIEKYPDNNSIIEDKIKKLLNYSRFTKNQQNQLKDIVEEKVRQVFQEIQTKMRGVSGIHLHRKLIEIACKTTLTITKIKPDILEDEFFIENYIKIKDPYGRNLLMTLWDSDLENLIPEEILKKEYLLEQDNYGSTCLHIAAIHQKLNHIPAELKTESHLINIKDKEGNSVLHRAILGLKGIPNGEREKLLTSKNLLAKNRVNKTPIDILLENFDPHRDKENLKHLCKVLPDKKILEFNKRYKGPEIQKILSRELTIRTIKKLNDTEELIDP